MKKSILLLISVCFVLVIQAQTATAPSLGDGTSGNPYQIASLNNLYWLSQNTTMWNKYYIQTADINATTSATWDSGAGFTPIGNWDTRFTGSYDGQGYGISGLTINRPDDEYVGFFGYIEVTGKVNNLSLSNVSIIGYQTVGGLVANYSSSENITNCHVSGTITAYAFVGLFAGGSGGAGTIRNCSASGTVTGKNYCIGGFVGTNSTTIEKSFFVGTIYANNGDEPTPFYTNVGGFVGANSDPIYNCYAIGTINAEANYSNIAGFIGGLGSGGKGINSYCAVAINKHASCTKVGALVGDMTEGMGVEGCVWDTTVCNINGYGYDNGDYYFGNPKFTASGYTTADFKNPLAYYAFDFVGESANGTADIWTRNSSINNNYPCFVWQTTVTGITNYKKIQANLYPNPTADVFQIGGFEGVATLSLYDTNGKLIFAKDIVTDEAVSLSGLPQGLYVAKLLTAEGSTWESKIVKK